MPENTVIYPGTFDPITYGHLDLITRAASYFDQLIVAVAADTGQKRSLFTVEERSSLIDSATVELANVRVISFQGLLADFIVDYAPVCILRGLRDANDLAYEMQLASANRLLSQGVETFFMPTAGDSKHISSSLVKEIAQLGGDVKQLVPMAVYEALIAKRDLLWH